MFRSALIETGSQIFRSCRLLLRLLFLASFGYGADHGLFKDCSRVPFCTAFRNQVLSSQAQFQAQISQLQENDNVITIPLSNLNGDQLNLQLSLLTNNKARIKILEPNHHRYELADVLDSEPQRVSYDITNRNDDSVTFSPKENKTYKVVVKKGPAFTVEFYDQDNLEIIFNASRLVMLNNDNDDEAFHFDIHFEGASKLYGLHHHAHKLALSETANGSMDPFRLRNSDTAGYEIESPMALYGAVPVVYGHSSARTSGVFLHNAAQQWVDISYSDSNRPSTHFMVESGTLDLFLMLGPTPKEVVRQFTELTGKAHMPQMWTLGYHQCRYSYQSQDDVKDVISKMDENDFPMDAIWLDIDYADEKKYFTWNPKTFSDPQDMQQTIASTNRKLVSIIDPHIKVDDEYHVYAGAKGKYFVKNENGTDFQGECWPGQSSWIDFLNLNARKYWAGLYSYENFTGSTKTLAGTWNDMNEPSVFNAYDNENSLPSNVLHDGIVKHKDIHNIYGFLQSKASHQGLLQRDDNKVRPFVLSRSHFAGSQRYAAMWTGDNRADFPYLPITYSECMLSNILGHVFCGADIGGFEGNPGDNLLQRWYQAANWLPFYRGHSNFNTNRREPYLFYESMRNVLRKAMKTRYRYIPVFYTLFFQHVKYGDPIIRPLFYEYTDMMDLDDHILVGSDILATPVMQQDATSIEAHFPGNSSVRWYRADLENEWSVHYGGTTETIQAEIDTSPVFYKGGSIIALKNTERRSTTDMLNDPYTVYVNLDSYGKAEGLFYDDDHTSFDYTEGQYFLIKLTNNGNSINIEQIEGNMQKDFVIEQVIVHNVTLKDKKKAHCTMYNTTADGTVLRRINIGHLLMSTNSTKRITLHF